MRSRQFLKIGTLFPLLIVISGCAPAGYAGPFRTALGVNIQRDAEYERDGKVFKAEFTNNEIMYGFAVDGNNVQREDGVHVVTADARVKDLRVSMAAPDVIGPSERALAAEIAATFCHDISRRIVRDPFEFGVLQTQGFDAPVWRYSQVCE